MIRTQKANPKTTDANINVEEYLDPEEQKEDCNSDQDYKRTQPTDEKVEEPSCHVSIESQKSQEEEGVDLEDGAEEAKQSDNESSEQMEQKSRP